jgi:hypothetical protein
VTDIHRPLTAVPHPNSAMDDAKRILEHFRLFVAVLRDAFSSNPRLFQELYESLCMITFLLNCGTIAPLQMSASLL